ATRPDFLAAFDNPFFRSQSIAASTLPSLSVSACLQSIMPAPVRSRRSLIIAVVIDGIWNSPCMSRGQTLGLTPIKRRSAQPLSGGRGGNHFLGLLDPVVFRDLTLQAKLPIEESDVGLVKLGDLPEMEYPCIIEPLLDARGDPGDSLQVVG